MFGLSRTIVQRFTSICTATGRVIGRRFGVNAATLFGSQWGYGFWLVEDVGGSIFSFVGGATLIRGIGFMFARFGRRVWGVVFGSVVRQWCCVGVEGVVCFRDTSQCSSVMGTKNTGVVDEAGPRLAGTRMRSVFGSTYLNRIVSFSGLNSKRCGTICSIIASVNGCMLGISPLRGAKVLACRRSVVHKRIF